MLETEIVKQSLIDELKETVKKSSLLKAVLKRATNMVFIVDYDSKKVTFDIQAGNITLFKKSYSAEHKIKRDIKGTDIYNFDRNDLMQVYA
jgi:hypothetical protein